MIKFKSFFDLYREALQKEDAPANSVAQGGVSLPPTMKHKKMDRRSKYHVEKMYKRALGKK